MTVTDWMWGTEELWYSIMMNFNPSVPRLVETQTADGSPRSRWRPRNYLCFRGRDLDRKYVLASHISELYVERSQKCATATDRNY